MLKVIYKYPIEGKSIKLPLNAKVLSAAMVKGEICIYALVDPTETAKKEHKVFVLGTGHVIQEDKIAGMDFVGTVVEKNELFGELVWHVWCGS